MDYGIKTPKRIECFFSSSRLEPNPAYWTCIGHFLQWQSGRNVKLSAVFILAPKLRMCGALRLGMAFKQFNWTRVFKRLTTSIQDQLQPSPKNNSKVKKQRCSATAMQAPSGREVIAPIHFWPRHYMGMSGQRHAPAELYLWERTHGYPFDMRFSGSHSWSGQTG
jgi:hypothetical protein